MMTQTMQNLTYIDLINCIGDIGSLVYKDFLEFARVGVVGGIYNLYT
jgi:hypothetical protein